MSVYNPIYVGQPWQQEFTTDVGAFADGAVLWLRLRRKGYQSSTPTGPYELARLSATSFRLSLTAEQTAGFREGAVEGDLMVRVGSTSEPVGMRLTVPVEKLI